MSSTRAAHLACALRTFRLPPEASVAQLRQAYLQEAKRLHPDRRADCDPSQAAREFAELRTRFEQAMGLLQEAEPVHDRRQWHTGQKPAPPWATGKPTANWRRNDQRWDWEAGYSGPYPGRPEGPVVGLPTRLVHSVTGSFALLAAGLFILRSGGEEEEPKMERDVGRLRQAIEAGRSADVGAEIKSGLDAQTRDAASYYEATTSSRRARSRNSTTDPTRVEPQLRDGVPLSPAHIAAQDGHVWWIERCGATSSCRETLDEGDRRGDTPLHHCARRGSFRSCCALLRVGADPGITNRWRLWPEDLAAYEGHREIGQILRGLRLRQQQDQRVSATITSDQKQDNCVEERSARAPPTASVSRAWHHISRHADGLGVLCDPPPDISYDGPHPSESLRHAMNLAVGYVVLNRLRLDRADPKDLLIACATDASAIHAHNDQPVRDRNNAPYRSGTIGREMDAVELALARVRSGLIDSGVQLEDVPADPVALVHDGAGWTSDDVLGLIMFEPPGTVSADAPGHWFAVRASKLAYYRLDSVRGSYRLTDEELAELVTRYKAWRILEVHAKRNHTPAASE